MIQSTEPARKQLGMAYPSRLALSCRPAICLPIPGSRSESGAPGWHPGKPAGRRKQKLAWRNSKSADNCCIRTDIGVLHYRFISRRYGHRSLPRGGRHCVSAGREGDYRENRIPYQRPSAEQVPNRGATARFSPVAYRGGKKRGEPSQEWLAIEPAFAHRLEKIASRTPRGMPLAGM